MTHEFVVPKKNSLLKKIATYAREQYELDLLKAQIKKERRELAELDDRQLRDIGISREDAAREAARKFDDIPRRRIRFMCFGC